MPSKLPTPPTPPLNNFVSRRILIPNNIEFMALVNGFVAGMLNEWRYVQTDGMPVPEAMMYFNDIWASYAESDGFMIGSVFPYLNGTTPPNCLPCDGSEHLKTDYPNLYALLDAAFIVDADTFKTPDLRGATVIGVGEAISGTIYAVGEIGGTEQVTLITAQIPAHTHTDSGHFHTSDTTVPAPTLVGEIPSPLGGSASIPTVTGTASANITSTGGDEAHQNMQPFVAIKYAVMAR